MLIDQLRTEYQQRFVVLPLYAWALKWNPDQPRVKGRWVKGGSTATELETCEAGEPGQCFRNANRWNTRHGIDTDRVVHGKVTNAEGKTFDHAWIERANGNVVDPTTGVVLPKDQYYKLLHAQPEATYTSKEAIRNQIRAMHHGPWTAADLAQKWDPDQPRDKHGRWARILDRMATLKIKHPAVAKNFPRSTHTEMGSIESHTKDVGREWEKQLTDEELAGISERFGSDVGKLLETAISLHDIGKAEAIESGAGKEAQHEHTIPIMQDVLRKEGFSEKDVSLATELLNHDLIGPLFRGYEGFKAQEAEVVAKLYEKAKKVGMNVADFVTLQLAFYQADASAYPYITQFMKQEPSGKWTFSGNKKIAAIEALKVARKYAPDQLRNPKGTSAGGKFKSSGVSRDEHGTLLDKTGQPLTVYHGSVSPDVTGSKLNPNQPAVRARSGPNGIYFTSDAASAYNYIRVPGAGVKGPRGRVIPAHIQMQNPLDITTAIKKERKKGLSFGEAKKKALEALTPDHDGVVFRGDAYNPDEYIVFSVAQVQSIARKFAAVLKYDPNQARGPKGSPEGGQFIKTTGRTFTSEEGYQWHEQGPVAEWAKALPYADVQALSNYGGFGYKDVNNVRRGLFVPSMVGQFIRVSSEEEYKASQVMVDAEYMKQHPHPFGRDPHQRTPDEPYGRVLDAEGNYVGHISVNQFYTHPVTGEKIMYSVQRAGPDLVRLAEVEAEANHLDDLIANRGYVLPEAITVERGAYLPGVTLEQLQDMQYEGRNGISPIWEEKGFTSTMVGDAEGRANSYPALGKTESLYNRYGQRMYDHQDEVGSAIRFHITLPAGTKVASLESVRRLSHEWPMIPNPDPMTEEQAKDPFWIKNPELWMKTDYNAVPKVDASDLEKNKEGRRIESELLLGSGARFRVVKVLPGKTYHFGDPKIHDIPIVEVYLEYIGGGSSDGGR